MTDSTRLVTNSQRIAPTRTESVLKVRFVQYGRHRRLTVIVNLIQKRCGHHKLLEALGTVHTDDELLKFIENNLDIEEKDINSLIRAEVKHYANFGYSGKW